MAKRKNKPTPAPFRKPTRVMVFSVVYMILAILLITWFRGRGGYSFEAEMSRIGKGRYFRHDPLPLDDLKSRAHQPTTPTQHSLQAPASSAPEN